MTGPLPPREPSVTNDSCALAGHPLILTTTQADTTPRPVACACGARRLDV